MTRDVVDVQLALAKQFTAEAKYPDAIEYLRRLPRQDQTCATRWTRDEIVLLKYLARTDVRIEPADQVSAVPFELAGNRIYVRANLNGVMPISFLVDTGAVRTVVTRARFLTKVQSDLRCRPRTVSADSTDARLMYAAERASLVDCDRLA
jgi:hypothetical protein